MVILVNAMGMRRLANYPTERAFPVSPPKLRDWSTSLGFNYERSHDRTGTSNVSSTKGLGVIIRGKSRHRAVVVVPFEKR